MHLTDYEKKVRLEIEAWQSGETSIFHQALNWAMSPVDWMVSQVVPQVLIDQASDAITQFLNLLNDASEWTLNEDDILEAARRSGLAVDEIAQLREQPLEALDQLARQRFSENSIMAAIEGGGFGLGGAIFIAADIPVLFAINFRLIQQIGASYGFSLRAPEYRPLVIHIFNVAASGSRQAKNDAIREMSIAAASFAQNLGYRGREASGTFREQNRHLAREMAKNLVGRKLGQMIPVAGAAVGAGVNYWFTTETARAAHMLFRNMYLERKERT